MNKEEIKRSIKEARSWAEGGEAVGRFGRERIAELEAQLAEAEKPELRHGDIRLWFNSMDDAVGIVDLSEKTPCMIWDGEDLRNAKTENTILSQSKSIGNIKKVFDDLKALSEPLKCFEYSDISGKINVDKNRATGVYIGGFWHTIKTAKILSTYIRRLIFTAEKEAAK